MIFTKLNGHTQQAMPIIMHVDNIYLRIWEGVGFCLNLKSLAQNSSSTHTWPKTLNTAVHGSSAHLNSSCRDIKMGSLPQPPPPPPKKNNNKLINKNKEVVPTSLSKRSFLDL